MSIQDYGWVYHNPDKPPKKCSCGKEYIVVGSTIACPRCDFTHLWPILGFDNTQ